MRPIVLALTLLALPLCAQTPATPESVVNEIDAIFSDPDRSDPGRDAFFVVDDAVRSARAEGRLSADWAILFAMLTDSARLDLQNPAYAVQLAQEGLALISGRADYWDYRTALQVSHAYALADLGRLDEAAEIARLSVDAFARSFGAEAARDLVAEADRWAGGQLGDFNTGVVDVSTAALDRATKAMAGGAFARAIALASAAILTDASAVDPALRRSLNARAELIIGHGQLSLARAPEAARAYLRGVNWLASAPFSPGEPITWAQGADPTEDRRRAFEILYHLAHSALTLDEEVIAGAALAAAERLTETPAQRAEIMLMRAAIAFQGGDVTAAKAGLAESRRAARGAGDAPAVAMADVYIEMLNLRDAREAGTRPDPVPLMTAVEAALPLQDPVIRIQTLTQAASSLRSAGTEAERLTLMRAALALAADRILTLEDSSFGQRAARRPLRSTIEGFLAAAHGAGATGLQGGIVREACVPEGAVAQCVLRRKTTQGD